MNVQNINIGTHSMVRRTNEDKVKAVIKALKSMPERSNHFIAEHVGVCKATIAKYRLLIEDICENSEVRSHLTKRIGKDGKRYSIYKRRNKTAISPNVMTSIRSHSLVNEHKYAGMSIDPLVEARAIFDYCDRVYLDILVSELRALLSGNVVSSSLPPALHHISCAFV